MRVFSKEHDLNSTKFVKRFYPAKGEKNVNIVFEPCSVVNSQRLRKYLSDIKEIDEQTVILLDYMFGDSSTPEIGEGSRFESIGTLGIDISVNGKEGVKRGMYHIPFTYFDNIDSSKFLNFIYHSNGVFYAMQDRMLGTQFRSFYYNNDGTVEDVKRIMTLLDGDNDIGDGCEILQNISLKASKTTLAKILISVLPHLDMKTIVRLNDFIQSEMLSQGSSEQVSKNILELKGDLIVYFYNVKNYAAGDGAGNLGNSCMRGDESTEQVRFYANNPTNVSLLTYIEKKKIQARAVMWKSIDGKYFIDRLFCSTTVYGTKLAAYCVKKGIPTIHYSTSVEYGIPQDTKCIVKLDNYELSRNVLPYLDTMHHIDIVSGLACPDITVLKNYLEETNADYLIKKLSCAQSDSDVTFMFKKNGVRELNSIAPEGVLIKHVPDDYLGCRCDECMRYYGRKRSLCNFTIVRKPKLSIVPQESAIQINENENVDLNWCENVLVKRYNSLRDTLVSIKDGPITKKYDKKNVVYSTFHKAYIPIKHSVYLPVLKSYVLKSVKNSKMVWDTVLLRKLRTYYSNRLVRIIPEAITQIKNEIEKVPMHEPLADFRASRVYYVKAVNISRDGIKIKGIVIPFKHLRFVKNESRKNQK